MNECRDVLTAVGDLGQLALEVADVRFEAITLPHLDREEVMAVFLGLLEGCVLGENASKACSKLCRECRDKG